MADKRDPSLDTLLLLDGQVFFIDDAGRYYVKFSVKAVPASPERPHGLDYSLTLHGEGGERLVGFDNAHVVPSRGGPSGRKRRARDHRHRLKTVPRTITETPRHCLTISGVRYPRF